MQEETTVLRPTQRRGGKTPLAQRRLGGGVGRRIAKGRLPVLSGGEEEEKRN